MLKHAAGELLSPDLRCFCDKNEENRVTTQEYLGAVA